MQPITEDHRDFVSSLSKGLAIIAAFSEQSPKLTLTEAARRTGLSRAGARRILLTLHALGYVDNDDGRFSLTPHILDLSFAYLSSTDWWDIARPYLEDVREKINESCSASVLDGTDIVYAAHVPSRHVMSIRLNLGARLPAYCTSMGRVLLAALPPDEAEAILERTIRKQNTPQTLVEVVSLVRELDKVRRQGFAFVDQELEPGIRSISVPLIDSRGKTLAALNIGGNAQRATVSQMTTCYLEALRKAAGEISKRLP